MKRHLHFTTCLLLLVCSFANAQQNLDSIFQIGQTALDANRYAEAQAAFYECHRSDPYNPDYLSNLGRSYYKLGNLPEASFYLKAMLKKDSLNLDALTYLAAIDEQLLDYRSALGWVGALINLDTANGYYHKQAGQLSENLGNSKLALRHYQQALTLNHADQPSLIAYCKLLVESGLLPLADSLMAAASKRQPYNLRLAYESAKYNYQSGNYLQALPKFEAALARGDTNLTYLPVYAYSLAQLERCGEALPWLHYLLEKKPPNERLYYYAGLCYQKLDSTELAVQHFELAIEAGLSPNLGLYHQRIGDVMYQQDKYKLALKYFELAQGYGNDDPGILFQMAAAFDQLFTKDKKRALEFYRKYLAQADGKNKEWRAYAERRVGEIAGGKAAAGKGE